MRMRSCVYAGIVATIAGITAFQTSVSAEEILNTGATWNAACSDAMTCKIATGPLASAEGGLALPAFIRADENGAPMQMVLPTPDGDETLSPKGKFTIAIDGKDVVSVSVKDLKRDPKLGGYVTDNPDIVQPVLDAAGKGKTGITVYYEGPDASELASADLSGFRKSLNWLDQQQHQPKS